MASWLDHCSGACLVMPRHLVTTFNFMWKTKFFVKLRLKSIFEDQSEPYLIQTQTSHEHVTLNFLTFSHDLDLDLNLTSILSWICQAAVQVLIKSYLLQVTWPMMTGTPCTGQMAPRLPASTTITPPSRASCRRSLTTCSGWRTPTSLRLTSCQTLSPWSPCWSVRQSSGSGQFEIILVGLIFQSPKSPRVISKMCTTRWEFCGSRPISSVL